MAAAEILIFTYFFVTFYAEKGTFLSPFYQNWSDVGDGLAFSGLVSLKVTVFIKFYFSGIDAFNQGWALICRQPIAVGWLLIKAARADAQGIGLLAPAGRFVREIDTF